MLIMGEWKHPYPAADGGYPGLSAGSAGRRAKYWPPVRRIDQAYGDRHLVCACPPPEAFE
jgi:glycine dehydrogenase